MSAAAPTSRSRPATALLPVLALVLALTACRVPPQSEWPVLTVWTTEPCARFLEPEYNRLWVESLGVRVEGRTLDAAQMLLALRRGEAADLLLINEPSALAKLGEEGLIAPEPWRFALRRDRMLVLGGPATSPLARPEDLARLRSLAMEDPQLAGYAGFLQLGLKRLGLWRGLDARVVRTRGAREVVLAVSEGRAEAGLVAESLWPRVRRSGGPRVVLTLDAWPEEPRLYLGAVAKTARDPRLARALLNYHEKAMRNAGIRLVPADPNLAVDQASLA